MCDHGSESWQDDSRGKAPLRTLDKSVTKKKKKIVMCNPDLRNAAVCWYV